MVYLNGCWLFHHTTNPPALFPTREVVAGWQSCSLTALLSRAIWPLGVRLKVKEVNSRMVYRITDYSIDSCCAVWPPPEHCGGRQTRCSPGRAPGINSTQARVISVAFVCRCCALQGEEKRERRFLQGFILPKSFYPSSRNHGISTCENVLISLHKFNLQADILTSVLY